MCLVEDFEVANATLDGESRVDLILRRLAVICFPNSIVVRLRHEPGGSARLRCTAGHTVVRQSRMMPRFR